MTRRFAALAFFLAASAAAWSPMAGAEALPQVAPRVIALEQGSNFRDLGGYVGAGQRKVRFGWIFRSGAMPELTERDYATLSRLNIRAIVDFRSLEERQVAPTLLDDRTGALYLTNDYAFATLMGNIRPGPDGKYDSDLYRSFPEMLVPQYRALFNRLLAHEGPVMFNCSAGQDRTGTAAALVLSALGVARPVILADYQLSTALRRPQFEVPAVDPARYPNNPVAAYYANARQTPGGLKAEPLYARDGKPYLEAFFTQIEQKWGSVDGYLRSELKLTDRDIKRLRQLYLH